MLDDPYVPFFGTFGAAWDGAMIAGWSANPLGMLWPERDAGFLAGDSGGGGRRPCCGGRSSRSPGVRIALERRSGTGTHLE